MVLKCRICGDSRNRMRGFRRKGSVCSACRAAAARAEMLAAGKRGVPCSRCGAVLEPRLMHWHHVDQSTKARDVSQCKTQAQVDAEVAKCILLCAECHRRPSYHR